MRKILFLISVLATFFFLASCASTPDVPKPTNYQVHSEFYGENAPVSILVMPPINKTDNVEAKDYFYYTLSPFLSNDGFYVFPPILMMQMLQEESAYDSEVFIGKDLSAFSDLFGADLLLFTTIKEWNRNVLLNKITVGIEYEIRSTRTASTLFKRSGTFTYDTNTNSYGGSLVVMIINKIMSHINAAVTRYERVGESCNYYFLSGRLPKGKYHPNHGLDGEDEAFGLGEEVNLTGTTLRGY
ncbi:MAG: DUF799 family lipoprotein [Treponema sp.]|nr:DUF799 family lipoprotein [Treponema sp.]